MIQTAAFVKRLLLGHSDGSVNLHLRLHSIPQRHIWILTDPARRSVQSFNFRTRLFYSLDAVLFLAKATVSLEK